MTILNNLFAIHFSVIVDKTMNLVLLGNAMFFYSLVILSLIG